MSSTILSLVVSVAFKLLDFWVKKNQKDKEMVESYYEFLKQVDKAGAAKVANYMSAENVLKDKQDELRKRLEDEANVQAKEDPTNSK